ncbi:MAG: L-threonylcarbamoyladenylate synthase, partial [Microcystaceae cyanobacterium]
MPFVSQSELITGAIAGKIVSFPTDTVPALAVKPEQSQQIYDLKQRSTEKPLILMAASIPALEQYWQGNEQERREWHKLMVAHWPGPLTLILPASAAVAIAINPRQNGTIALRIPKSELALAILSAIGPLATTSANRSGELPLETMTAIAATFPTVLTLNCGDFANNQKLGNGQPSTIVQWQNQGWSILRSGK